MSRPKKLGLALSGGGARGLAHIGVLQVLEEAGVEIAAITGTSMGAIVGAGYAVSLDSRAVRKKYYDFLKTDLYKRARFDFIKEASTKQHEDSGLAERLGGLFKRVVFKGLLLTRSGLLSPPVFREIIDYFIPEMDFRETRIPFACPALDLTEGRTRIFREGSLPLAVMASASIPGLTEPVEIDGHYYSDGGATMFVPVEPLFEMGAEVVAAVDLDRGMDREQGFANVVEVIIRWADAAASRLREFDLAGADLIIKPPVGDHHWSDFQNGQRFMDLGRQAALESLPAIRRLVQRRWWALGGVQAGSRRIL